MSSDKSKPKDPPRPTPGDPGKLRTSPKVEVPFKQYTGHSDIGSRVRASKSKKGE